MRIQKITTLCIASALLLVAAGCDITTEPKSSTTDAVVFTDAGSYEAFLAKLYGGLAVTGQVGPNGNGDFERLDEGFSHYGRQLWQLEELPTDEAVIAWGDAGLPELHTQLWASSNQFVQMMYSRIFYQVSLVNEFLRETTSDKLSERGQESLAGEVAGFRAEARFLRALSYWHGIDLFGDIPLVTEDFPIGSTPPEQSTRSAIYSYIVNELNDVKSDLPPAGAGEYGRADQGAVSMLLAKLYMNAGVYVGAPDYGSAMSEVQQVIAGSYSLSPSYQNMFLADNGKNPEFIFVTPYDGVKTKTWGGTTFLAHAGCGGSMDPVAWGMDFCWWGLRVDPKFVALFPNPADSPDSRAIFWTDGQNLEVTSISDFAAGWGAPKYKNITSLGAVGQNATHPDIDFPIFRLADAYLMYAELVLRGGGGDMGTAVGYINQLRQRAYGDASGNITAGDLTLQFVLDERARELWWEGHRRTDLIRYGLFTGGDYLWAWKGNSQAGSSTPDTRNLYPIPASELVANPNLTQNPGY
ncbi:MAG: RagB/SusD family nutrient uptake outer membrane protein [Candidatus Palauibacterales bacterium]|nr:RagB/SusD family nutrient uptake outer membrane protein [Candidatus Palauibacterales bacterium]